MKSFLLFFEKVAWGEEIDDKVETEAWWYWWRKDLNSEIHQTFYEKKQGDIDKNELFWKRNEVGIVLRVWELCRKLIYVLSRMPTITIQNHKFFPSYMYLVDIIIVNERKDVNKILLKNMWKVNVFTSCNWYIFRILYYFVICCKTFFLECNISMFLKGISNIDYFFWSKQWTKNLLNRYLIRWARREIYK